MRYFKTDFHTGPEKFRFPGFLFAPGRVRRDKGCLRVKPKKFFTKSAAKSLQAAILYAILGAISFQRE